MSKYIDLHTHTWFSDGGLSPTQLVEEAKEVGLSAIAITDHDTVGGVPEAMEAGKGLGIEVIPREEMSTDFQDHDLHIVGYFENIGDQRLNKVLYSEGLQREEKAKSMILGFQKLGYHLDYEEIKSKTAGTIGRPHLAVALVNNPDNAAKLLEDFGEEVTSTQKIFDKYLGGDCEFYQKYAHVESSLTTEEAIEIIHQAKGLSFLAHPHWDFTSITKGKANFVGDEKIRLLQGFGLYGIEAINFRENLDVSKQMVRHYTLLAEELGMLISGGSDYHGFGNAGKSLGLKEEHMLIDYEILTRIKARLNIVS